MSSPLFLIAMALQDTMATNEIGKQNYARTPFTGSKVVSTDMVQAASVMDAAVEKRDSSQLQLYRHRWNLSDLKNL